jgi:hypothetical protein
MKNLNVIQIKAEETHDWFKNRHYAKTLPKCTSYAFGLYDGAYLIGVVSYGDPTGRTVLEAMTSKEYIHPILELNRLCLLENKKNYASFLIGNSLKLLPKPNIIISYADKSINHAGYIYQATNFIYCGLSEKRTDWIMKGINKHPRGVKPTEEMKKDKSKFELIERARKHRYIYYLGNKKQKKQFMENFKYEILPYPKTENKYYETTFVPNTQMALI